MSPPLNGALTYPDGAIGLNTALYRLGLGYSMKFTGVLLFRFDKLGAVCDLI